MWVDGRCAPCCAFGGQRMVCRGWLSLSVIWDKGFQFRWSSLATNNFTCHTILLTLELFFGMYVVCACTHACSHVYIWVYIYVEVDCFPPYTDMGSPT